VLSPSTWSGHPTTPVGPILHRGDQWSVVPRRDLAHLDRLDLADLFLIPTWKGSIASGTGTRPPCSMAFATCAFTCRPKVMNIIPTPNTSPAPNPIFTHMLRIATSL
jgi:hypothetical protein